MNTESFSIRHIGPRESDLPKMLETVKASTLDELINDTIPSNIRLKEDIKLESPMNESDYLMHLKKMR